MNSNNPGDGETTNGRKLLACTFSFLFQLSLFTASAAPPTISPIADQGVFPSSTGRSISFQVSDDEDAPGLLSLSAFSSNTELLPVDRVMFGGSGSNRVVSFSPVSGLTGTSQIAIVVTDTGGASSTNLLNLEVSYFSSVATPAITNANNGRWADYDADGDLDLFAGSNIYRNDGDTNFLVAAVVSTPFRNAVEWADYDRDGDLDLATGNTFGAQIWRNDGMAGFHDIAAGLTNVMCDALAWGDYDNDGRLDLLTAGGSVQSSKSFTRLYRNAGNDSFTYAANAGFTAMASSAVEWADFDLDGRLDVLINGRANGSPLTWQTDVYRNVGNGSFTRQDIALYGVDSGSVSAGDYDNDGDLDLLTSGFHQGAYVLRVYRNDGSFVFTDINLGQQGTAYGDTQFVDFDNDGYLDIFTAGCTNNFCETKLTTLYRNDREGSFVPVEVGLPTIVSTSATWGDFDRDGDLDLFFGGLHRNNSPVSNSPPTAPNGLTVDMLPDNNVRFRWAQGADAESSGKSLSYALYVGTQPGVANYVSAQANPANGFRRLPLRGAINTNSITLHDMPKGTFFWSVQAIDSSLDGSAFAAEQSFMVTNARPQISAISNQITAPYRGLGPLYFTVSDEETPAESLLVSATSSNTNVILQSSVIFGGSGTNRWLTIYPYLGVSGTSTISVNVADARGLIASSRFDIVVQTFTPLSVGIPTNGYAMKTAWADFDRDGDLDLAFSAMQSTGGARVFRNNSGQFAPAGTNLAARSDNEFAWADYDNDGDLDLTEIGWSSGYTPATYVYRCDGTNTLTPVSGIGLPNAADGSIAWGDYDNDGDLDALVTGDPDTYHSANGFTGIYRNNKGVFVNSGIVLPAVCRGAAVWGDLDNDGDLDIVMSGQTNSSRLSGITRIYRNSAGAFAEIATSLPGITESGLALADCDKDGDLDLAFSGLSVSNSRVAGIYRNTGTGSFTNSGIIIQAVTEARLAWGDYTRDGYPDLVISGRTTDNANSAATKVYRNDNEHRTFRELVETFPSVYRSSVSWADYDRDGDLDLLVGSHLLRNNINLSNTPPSIPTNTSSLQLSKQTIRLQWNKASDAEPGGTALNYNLRVGITPGGNEIMSSQSSANGQRLLPHRGNIGGTNAWTLTLPFGTYYWSVQAVDAGFTGSAFSVEKSFVLTNSRPVAFNILSFVNEDTPRSITLNGFDDDGDVLTYTITAQPTNGTLSGTAPAVIYTPNTNFFGRDTFKYIVSDGFTNSLTASMAVTVSAVRDVATNTLKVVSSAVPFQITASGEPHQMYAVEFSTNLVNWIQTGSFRCDSVTGEGMFTDAILSDQWKFYRVRELP